MAAVDTTATWRQTESGKVYKTFPNLFELGTLPDLWFELAEKETFSDPSVVR